ncbi:LacI family DNA-binding transcriptional regulator [Streptomyces fuscichromogenes]|uniref:LacI family transcriptional regulator n=1 Tax=Streptomyces fuscichromogenes TaxID=1324013 RepID=A0A917X9V8_9ACTN|nr:LacI family DNA-binding transcriptional regulator [Streptomyces fuscichromogenes]GGM98587.1 LacI family transcriptional regulator [Streptomyces fuscichromogenes]
MTRSLKRTTSADVAREAGVSRTTVSYVLNNRPGQVIPEETRRRVMDAAERLHYRPHAGARALAAGHTDVVLLSLADLPMGPSLGRYVEELAGALAEHGLTLVTHLMSTHGRTLTDVCAAVGASAVLGFRSFDEQTVQALHSAGAVVVLPTTGQSSTMTMLGHAQAAHLIERGHRRIGYLSPVEHTFASMAEDRLHGVADACARTGLTPPDSRVAAMEIDPLSRLAARWVEQGITAVCSYNDEYAIGLLAAMQRIGLNAPGDLAVVGADDIPVARFAQPALSTVYVDLHEAGRQRAEAVAAGLHHRKFDEMLPVSSVRLVVRDSS